MKPRKTKPLMERLGAKVDRYGPIPSHCPDLGRCWVWLGGKALDGHGRIREGRAGTPMLLPHRVVLEHKMGRSILEGFCALHHCDNPSCVNPEHLYEGTPADNEADKKARNRHARGATHGSRVHPKRVQRGSRVGRAKLTEETVATIPRMVRTLGTRTAVAQKLGVTKSIITRILARRIWAHVQLEES